MFFGGSGGDPAARRAGTSGTNRTRRTWTVAVLAASGIGLIGLGVAARRAETVVPVTRTVHLHQRATMTYAATMARGPAYPTGTLRTGDPVFLRLVPRMNVHIVYRVAPDADSPIASGLHGTRRVTAELRSANGWHRGVELLPRTAFSGSEFAATATLDLARVRRLITGMARSTGVTTQVYTLSVRTEIALSGDLYDSVGPTDGYGTRARNTLQDSFFPEVTFRYDRRQMQLTRVARTTGPISAVVRQQVTSRRIAGTGYGHLDLLGQSVPVRPLRTGGLVVGVLLLLIAGVGRRARPAPRPTTGEPTARRAAAPEPPARRPEPTRRPSPAARLTPGPTTRIASGARIVLDERRPRVPGSPNTAPASRNAVPAQQNAVPNPRNASPAPRSADPARRNPTVPAISNAAVPALRNPALPAPRSATRAQRHWARTHPTAHERG